MENPKNFLLNKIVNYEKNGLKSLGLLNAKHFEDLVFVIREFAEATAKDVIERLNNGEKIEINGEVFFLKKKRKN